MSFIDEDIKKDEDEANMTTNNVNVVQNIITNQMKSNKYIDDNGLVSKEG